MKNCHTVPLEVLASKPDGVFFTEPYEAGWADEAIVMIYVRECHGTTFQLRVKAQLSVDGVRWFDHPADALSIREVGGVHLPLTQFGNWLRLVGGVTGGPGEGRTACLLDLYLVLKG